MWTNIFRIGGLNQLSWFQFLPNESDVTSLPDKSDKSEQRDAATLEVLSSHLQLQKEGFLSTWTNSFVGPWDPSQGMHNPDEKIKLWLFLPGRHSSVVETAQAAVSRLRVVSCGLWVSPGDSEEVATALSQALKNRLERALTGLSYVRFGDVFSRYRPYTQSEELFRKGHPTIECVFAATEDAIFVHVILSTKHVRTLSGGDMEKVLKLSSNNLDRRLPVIVSPHGMRGKATGCCSSDLVKHVYIGSGTSRTSTTLVGLPYPVSQASGCKLRGQNCYIEVTLGCSVSGSEKQNQPDSNLNRPNHAKPNTPSIARGEKKGSVGDGSICEKTFIYPTEAVLVPVLQTTYARSSLKRFWLQNWTGLSLSSSTLFMHCGSEADCVDDSWSESDGLQYGRNSSSNSNSSSISSLSSSSSDSDCKTKGTPGDLEADADSLTGRQSSLSSVGPMEINGSKQGAKRPRAGIEDSLVQAGSIINAPAQDYNSSDITGVANDKVGSHWDWDDDDDRGGGMDIQALLSEFGDFGDFFENDALPFGEPPGTAESQAFVFSGQECIDGGGSPSAGVMDVSDPMHLSMGFPTFESFNPPPIVMEECISAVQEPMKSTSSSAPVSCAAAASTVEFDHVMKAEALLTFAPEYGAIDTPSSELSSTIFRSPYQPKSQKADSLNSSGNNYVYGATPPLSPCSNGVADKHGVVVDSKIHTGKHDNGAVRQKFYTQVESSESSVDRKSVVYNNTGISQEGTSVFLISGLSSTTAVKSVQNMRSDVANSAKHLLLSQKTVPAAELECHMFQASMCRIRHALLSVGNPASTVWRRSTGNTGLGQLSSDPSSMIDTLSSKYEMRKKESIPVRIAGDIEGGMLDGPFNAPIGVWRSVGAPKPAKPANTPTTEVFSLSHHSFNEESMTSNGQRPPLQDFLDSISLLVQQAASFVDIALDGECADGPYGWLALQEQWRRGFCCGPNMVHAGCGGVLASCHSFDIAGVPLLDPISSDVQASSMISLLQSDVRTALKSAFGTLDGPLSVIDWCKGRQSGDAGTMCEALSAESTINECRDSSNSVMTTVGDPNSPSQPSGGVPSGLRDGSKVDDTCQRRSNQELSISVSEQQLGSRKRPTLCVLPYPSILVGYQDDWLKTSASSLQLWEKAPLEPYAFQKHMSYYVVCPNIDPLASAAADFFQQLGTVYEMCKLGTHAPQSVGNQMEIDSGKCSTSGFVMLDSPRSMKIESNTGSPVGSISDYFLSLSNGWDLPSFLKSLTKALKTLQLGSGLSTNAKEGHSTPCTVIYIVCPFPDPTAVLQTVVESSVAIGSTIFSSDNDKRSLLHGQVGKALSYAAGVDETSISNIPALSGFNIPRLVLQIVPVDAIFRVTSPSLNELVMLKEIAFTVYHKARCISRGSSNDVAQSSAFSGRSHSLMVQMTNPIPGMWKDCVGSRISGPSIPREGELDPGLRAGTWDNTWQTARAPGLGCDPNRSGELLLQEELHYMFEPLFILAEPGSVEQGMSPNVAMEFTKQASDDSSGGFMQGSAVSGDAGASSQVDGSEADGYGSGQHRPPPSLHCCYGWTEDWRWLVCIWTDSRGELLDNHIFPFGGISSRQDTKGMQNLFVQVLQQGCQILQGCTSDNGASRPRDFVITRIGCFYELECQEWQKALYSIGGSEVKKWPLQLRRAAPDVMPTSSNGVSLQQQEMERSLPSSPSRLYSSHTKSSGFIKGGLGQTSGRKQLIGGATGVDGSRGLLQWVQSISFVSIMVDHSLHLLSQAEVCTGSTQGSGVTSSLNYLEGFSHVRSLGSTPASYIVIPSPSMHFLTPTPLQLPTCLTSESPPLAHLLHSKGYAIPLSTGFVVSKAVPSLNKANHNVKDEWPSVLSVSLVDYYGGYGIPNDKLVRATPKQGGRGMVSDARDYELEIHMILESLVAELHALSWLTVSPAYLERRSALPFHCDMVLRLRRLLHFAEKEISRQPEKLQV